MKKFVLSLLFVCGCVFANAQNDNAMPLRVPFEKNMPNGPDYPAVRFEGLELKPVYFGVRSQPEYSYSGGRDSVTVVQMNFDTTMGDGTAHTIGMRHYITDHDPHKQMQDDFPRALGEYLIGMEIEEAGGGRPKVFLTIEKSHTGREFFLHVGQEAVVDGLSIRFDMALDIRIAPLIIGGKQIQPGGSMAGYSLTLSHGGVEKSIDSDSRAIDEGPQAFEFGAYKVWMVDDDGVGRMVKLKVEKS